jgi:hypothetical protein
MNKRNLVIVRAGDSSLHPGWLVPRSQRNWDLVVNYFGDDEERYRDDGEGVLRIDSKGPKWPALHELLGRTWQGWREYERIWLPDDDLECQAADIDRLFDLMPALDLHLAQPSLSWNSYISLILTAHNPNFALRYTSFVEPMAPCFSRQLLERVLPTFGEIISGWGLDYIWPRYLDNPPLQCAVIDRVQVRHTRPVGGPNYQFNQQAGKTPQAEMQWLLAKHGMSDAMQLAYGGLDRDGRRTTLFDASGPDFIYRLCEGYLELGKGRPQLLGTVFDWHAQARRSALAALETPATAAQADTPPVALAA